MNLDVVEYIKNLPLFAGVPRTTLLQLVEDAQLQTFAQNEVLIQKGAPSDSLFVVYSGSIKVVGSGYRGRELVLNEFGPGQIIGETPLIDRFPRSASVVATSPTQVVAISFDAFLTALKQSPKLTENFIGMMLDRVRFSGRYVEKAIEWSQAIAEGDYRAVERQIEAAQTTQDRSNQASETRIESLLSAFFKMVEGVKRREDYMKKQLEQQFEIHIDAGKKDEEVENLAKRTFFYRVKSMADQMRARRRQQTGRDE